MTKKLLPNEQRDEIQAWLLRHVNDWSYYAEAFDQRFLTANTAEQGKAYIVWEDGTRNIIEDEILLTDIAERLPEDK